MDNILAKTIKLIKVYQHHIFLGVCITLISFISFNLGKINALHKTPITITDQEANIYRASSNPKSEILSSKQVQNSQSQTQKLDTRVVVSKASTSRKYHFTWCPGAKKIKETNKVWFDNESLAQKAGYTLAANCQ